METEPLVTQYWVLILFLYCVDNKDQIGAVLQHSVNKVAACQDTNANIFGTNLIYYAGRGFKYFTRFFQ